MHLRPVVVLRLRDVEEVLPGDALYDRGLGRARQEGVADLLGWGLRGEGHGGQAEDRHLEGCPERLRGRDDHSDGTTAPATPRGRVTSTCVETLTSVAGDLRLGLLARRGLGPAGRRGHVERRTTSAKRCQACWIKKRRRRGISVPSHTERHEEVLWLDRSPTTTDQLSVVAFVSTGSGMGGGEAQPHSRAAHL